MRKIYILILLIVSSYAIQAQIFVAADATGNTDGSSWANAYTNLQDGIDAAMALGGEVIWVKAGTYRRAESGSRNQKFLINTSGDISIYGGFNGTETALSQRDFRQNVTTISAEYGTNLGKFDQFLEVTTVDNLLDGFHISGFNNVSGGVGVININSGGFLTMVNCVIENNSSSRGGIIYAQDGFAKFYGCHFNNNTSDLAILFIQFSFLPTIFSEFINCLIADNSGLIIYSEFGLVRAINNTIYNTTSITNAVMDLGFTFDSEIYNNIIWNNSNSQIAGNSSTIISNNIIESTSLAGNFSVDPQLKDPSSGDYRLKSCSPARNLGNNTLLPAIFTTDLNGDQRIFDTTLDLGAYELQVFPVQINTFETFDVACFGASTGEIAVGAVGGTGTLEYSTDGINFTSQPLLENLPSGNYTITVRDADGCTETGNTLINELTTAPVQVSIMASNVSCFGEEDGEILISGTGGSGSYSYSTDGVNFTPVSTILDGLVAGEYTILLRDINGCEDNTMVNISQPAELLITTNITSISCNGQSDGKIEITATGGASGYEFSIDGTNFGPSTTFDNLNVGPLTVSLRDANNCLATQDVIITEPAALNGSIVVFDITCNSANDGIISFSATGGTGNVEASIDGTNFQSGEITGLSSGNYTVTIRDVNGCEDELQATISEPAALSVGFTTTDIDCSGDNDGRITISSSGGTMPLMYSLDGVTFQSDPIFNGLSGGNYTVIIKDANGCELSEVLTVVEPQPFNLNETVSMVACNGEANGRIELVATGGNGSYEYSIDGINFSTSGEFSELSAGVYIVFLRDGTGCAYSEELVITEPEKLVLSADFNGIEVSLTATGGTAPYEYSVDGTTFQSESIFTLGNGSYTFAVRDANSCEASTQESTIVTAYDFNSELNITIYPNPSNTNITIAAPVPIMYIGVIDFSGKELENSDLNDQKIELDISSLEDGVYIIKIIDSEGNIYHRKLLKK